MRRAVVVFVRNNEVSLTSPHTKRVSGSRKFRSLPQKDFCNNIGTFRTCHPTLRMSAYRGRTEVQARLAGTCAVRWVTSAYAGPRGEGSIPVSLPPASFVVASASPREDVGNVDSFVISLN